MREHLYITPNSSNLFILFLCNIYYKHIIYTLCIFTYKENDNIIYIMNIHLHNLILKKCNIANMIYISYIYEQKCIYEKGMFAK